MSNIPTTQKFSNRTMIFNIVEDFLNPAAILPPLYMQINPQNFSQTHTKIINRYQTFGAYIEEYWGEELDTISCSFSTGGFYHEDVGLTALYRSDTKAYFNFQDLLDIYRNNGNIYDDSGIIVKKGSVVMSFDEGTYFGYFENFNFTEDSTTPFRFTFDFIFKVEKDYLSI